ncbi:MAG: ABC transporter permease subunit [Chthoniobacterales bacterium]|nr:ABC transporter permease subunit [Chthoniobacterales bacterium]
MNSSLLRRLASLALVLFSVVSITFFLIRLSPGGPFDGERKIPPAIEQQLLAKYKLDGTLWEQYSGYLGDLMHGDLRLSTKYRNRSVNEILAQTLPVTLCLGGVAFLLAAVGGIWLGTLAAMHQHTWRDFGAMFLALAAISLPAYIVGPLLILVFGLDLRWLPVGGWGGWREMVLPTITLAAPAMAAIARLMRGSMVETLQQDFIRTARAKGLRESAVVYRHALRIAVLPVVSYLGPLAAHLLTGSIIVETIFHIPGAGGFFVNSILNRDGFLLGGMVIVYCVLLVLFNLFVDFAYGLLDRRIRG